MHGVTVSGTASCEAQCCGAGQHHAQYAVASARRLYIPCAFCTGVLCCAVCCADLGIVDPVELVAMQRAKQREQLGHSHWMGSNGSNGGSNASETSSSVDETVNDDAHDSAAAVAVGATAGFRGAREWPSLGRYDPETDRFVGGSADGGADGRELTGEEQLALKVSSEGSDMTQQGNDWGLLQLDLSFAWGTEDQPVGDVEKLQRETPARQAQVKAQMQA